MPDFGDKFHVLRRLGQGGMGVIYAVRHRGLGIDCAMKLMSSLAPEAFERFEQEAQSVARLNDNPHVVRVYDFDKLRSGEPYLLMELLRGEDLDHILRREHAIAPSTAIRYLVQACRALAEAHRLNIIHRDIKPGNLFLHEPPGGPPVVKVLDFGIAKLRIEDETNASGLTHGALLGTPLYMAPEQWRGERVDERTDIWSLGVVLYQMIEGRVPFDGKTRWDLQLNIVQAAPSPIRATSDEGIQRAISRCLEKDPANRFPDVVALAEALVHTDLSARPMVQAIRNVRYLGQGGAAFADTEVGEPAGDDAMPFAKVEQVVESARRRADWVPARPVLSIGEDEPLSHRDRPSPEIEIHTLPLEQLPAPSSDPDPEDGENVRFTLYRPATAASERWHAIVVTAALAERRRRSTGDATRGANEPGGSGAMARASDYATTVQDAECAIRIGSKIRFVIRIDPSFRADEVTFDSVSRTFEWLGPEQREEFRFRVSRNCEGRTISGRLLVFLESILISEVDFAIKIDSAHVSSETAAMRARSPYRKIFASYSHKDAEIVMQFERFAGALGDTYLRDVMTLRSGEKWNERLKELIAEADVFQLFWSWNAIKSKFVRQEWEHALSLGRPNFVRPVYWEEPLPAAKGLPSDDLSELHFEIIPWVKPSSDGWMKRVRQLAWGTTRSRVVTVAFGGSASVFALGFAQKPPDLAPRPLEPAVVVEVQDPTGGCLQHGTVELLVSQNQVVDTQPIRDCRVTFPVRDRASMPDAKVRIAVQGLKGEIRVPSELRRGQVISLHTELVHPEKAEPAPTTNPLPVPTTKPKPKPEKRCSRVEPEGPCACGEPNCEPKVCTRPNSTALCRPCGTPDCVPLTCHRPQRKVPCTCGTADCNPK
jgi:serine/threonine protein kinase